MTSNSTLWRGEAKELGAIAISILLLCIALIGLFTYKWPTASSVIATVRSTHQWSGSFHGLAEGGVLTAGVFYFQKIWRALAYGLAIGAAVQTACGVAITRFKLRDMPMLRSTLSSCALGVPLMLCSCCVTPLAVTLLRKRVRVGSVMALLLASPVLNPAAIVLTFLLFPLHLGVARLIGACVIATLLPVAVEWRGGLPSRDTFLTVDRESVKTQRHQWTWFAVLEEFVRNALRIGVVTIPLLVLGVLASSTVMPLVAIWSKGLIAGFFVATIAVLVALPTFFEIPIALALLSSGSPGAAAAVLIAGPAINVGSLIVVSREIGPKPASLIALGVWLVACSSVLIMA